MEDHFKNNTKHMVYGQINIGSKIFQLFGINEIIIPYRTITSIFFVYKTYISSNIIQNLPAIGIKIKAGNTLNVRSSSTGVSQQIDVNQTMTQSTLSIETVNGPLDQSGLSVDVLILIELAYHD